MKVILALLVVAVIAMAALSAREWVVIRGLERAVEQISARLPEKDAAASFDLQAKCAKQARKAFAALGYAKDAMAGFENHYNSRLNKCFIHVTNTDAKISPGTIWTHRDVFDAVEGKAYGTYSWHTEKDKKYWEVPPFQCEATLPSGEKRLCNSDAEFTELMKIYMEGEP